MRYRRKYDLNSILNFKAVKIKPPFTWFTIIATWFGIGLIPIMSGTLASLAVYPVYWLILHKSDSISSAMQNFYIMTTIIAFLGTWAVYKYQKATNTIDHKSVVIDEVLGMLLAFSLAFNPAYSIAEQLELNSIMHPSNMAFIIVFIIFRFFDIVKPFFIRTIDKYVKNAYGVMLDDALAGLYTGIFIVVFEKLYNLTGYLG